MGDAYQHLHRFYREARDEHNSPAIGLSHAWREKVRIQQQMTLDDAGIKEWDEAYDRLAKVVEGDVGDEET